MVQGYLARIQLEEMLKILGCLDTTGTLPANMPKVGSPSAAACSASVALACGNPC